MGTRAEGLRRRAGRPSVPCKYRAAPGRGRAAGSSYGRCSVGRKRGRRGGRAGPGVPAASHFPLPRASVFPGDGRGRCPEGPPPQMASPQRAPFPGAHGPGRLPPGLVRPGSCFGPYSTDNSELQCYLPLPQGFIYFSTELGKKTLLLGVGPQRCGRFVSVLLTAQVVRC